MPRPGVSHCTLNVDLVRELRVSERLISWIQRVDDFEPPLQDQTESVQQDAHSENGTREKRPSTPKSGTITHAHSNTRSVTLSRSRYCQSLVKDQGDHDQDRDTRSVITLSRSHTPSGRPKTARRTASPHIQEDSLSKTRNGRDHTRTPTQQTKEEPINDDDSPVGASRQLVSPHSRGSPSPAYCQPPSPSLLHRHVKQRVLLIPAPAPSAQWLDDDVFSIPPSVIAQVRNGPQPEPSDDFEDELEALREQDEQETRLRATAQRHPSTVQRSKPEPASLVGNKSHEQGYIDDELEALLIQEQEAGCLADDLLALHIHEQEEDNQGRIKLIPRTDEEYRQLQPSQSPSPWPSPPIGNYTSLYEIWSSALEEYYFNNPANLKRPRPPISVHDLLSNIAALENTGKLLSPSFTKDGPPCKICSHPSTFGRVTASNPNGNAHRPFYNCRRCGEFITWADLRGVSADNPACDCRVDERRRAVLPSRMTVTGDRAASGPGRVFYTCAEERCRFWEWRKGDEPARGERPRGRW